MLMKAVKFVLFAASAGIVFGYVLMWLWNALIPDIFHATPINFWQGIGLLILARLLFGGFGHRWGGHRWKDGKWKKRMEEKLAAMTPEQREKIQAYYGKSCYDEWERCCKKEETTN